jgi:pimeloyl-ACP methyl ester carboxylesterase
MNAEDPTKTAMLFRTVAVDDVTIFYREAGAADAPALLLLHGFPSSSHMYRDLISKLADQFRLVAPDYPGYGFSDAPPIDRFRYTFDHLADVIDGFTEKVGLTRYALYMQDFGGPIGFRMAVRRPERIQGLIIQNAVAHIDGLSESIHAPAKRFWEHRNADTEQPMREFLTLESTRFQYLHGAENLERVSPDGWTLDQALLDRPGQTEIQLAMLYDYRTNPPRYAEWQAYLRERTPPTLVVWGRNDPFFTAAGATAYMRDVPHAEVHLLNGGHFVLEEHSEAISWLIKTFWARRQGQASRGFDTTRRPRDWSPVGPDGHTIEQNGRVDPVDRVEIIDALYRFAAGQDLHDRALFESAFSTDARVDFTGPARRLGVTVPVFEGRQQIADMILASTRDLDTTHTVTNPRVTAYDGERARLSALVEANHCPAGDHSRHLLLKNIYTVELSKADRRWVIDDMRIDNVWLTGDTSVLFPT